SVHAEIGTLHITENGQRRALDILRLRDLIAAACEGLDEYVDTDAILKETVRNLYEGVSLDEVFKSSILAARTMIEKDPAYGQVAARLLLHTIRREVIGEEVSQGDMTLQYARYFTSFISEGIRHELLDPELGRFDLQRLAQALDGRRDLQFGYLGLQTLYDRY